MRYLLYLLFFVLTTILTPPNLSAQDVPPVDMKWSKVYKKKKNFILTKIVPMSNGQFATVSLYTMQNLLEKVRVQVHFFDKSLQLQSSQIVKLKRESKTLNYEDAIFLDGKLYIISSYFNKRQKTNYLFAQEVASGQQLKPFKKIAEGATLSIYKRGNFDLSFSADSSKILVLANMPDKRKEEEKLACFVLNRKLELLWERELEIPYNGIQFTVSSARVDNEGNVYLMNTLYFDKLNKVKNNRPNFQFMLNVFTKQGKEQKEFPIRLTDQFINDLAFKEFKEGRVICCGFYSDRNAGNIGGICYLDIDVDNAEIRTSALTPLNFETLTQGLSDRKIAKAKMAILEENNMKKPELYSYTMRDFILRNDGGALVIGEQFFTNVNVGGPSNSTTTTTYNYNNIVIANANPNGNIDWSLVIPKKQESDIDNGYFLSYGLLNTGRTLSLIYNDHPKNVGQPDWIRAFKMTNVLPTITTVHSDGSIQYDSLLSSPVSKPMYLVPKLCKQVNRHQMLIPVIHKSNNRMIIGLLTR